MATFLFDRIIFGPVRSRRLGNSLGINVLPVDAKICSFDCIYCECGWTGSGKRADFPTLATIKKEMRTEIKNLSEKAVPVDTITFAGNGEPTLHPDFPEIIKVTCILRDTYYPEAAVAVLSNGSQIQDANIRKALCEADQVILKLDSALPEKIKEINRPRYDFDLNKYVSLLDKMPCPFIIQTMFISYYDGKQWKDNASGQELKQWLELISKIKPQLLMLYTIARDTASENLKEISKDTLQEIADALHEMGLPFKISVST